MYEKEFYIAALMAAQLRNELTAAQEIELQEWMAVDSENRALFEALTQEKNLQTKLEIYRRKDLNPVWIKTKALMQQAPHNLQQASRKGKPLYPQKAVWMALLSIAAVCCVCFALYMHLNVLKEDSWRDNEPAISYISAGKVGATLTLADGRQIALDTLDQGDSEFENGIVVRKSGNGELTYELNASGQLPKQSNTLSTTKGQTYLLRLPDKSKVWLNASSSLTFTTDLNKAAIRRVQLKGEAYFEVASDKKRPFIVETDRQEIEVLGTHFNVNSYPDEPASMTTLIEGSIRLTAQNFKQVLQVGQQAISSTTRSRVQTIDPELVVDWKNGDFNLDQIDFKVAMRKIARWYDLDIIYDSSLPQDLQTGGWISRNSKLSDVLKLIESSGLVHFKIQDRTLYVYK